MSAAVPDRLFDRDGWWNPACREFASLRSVTEYRLALLRAWLPDWWPTNGGGRVLVDLGCGGGLLAVPFAATGARVVGVDLAPQALAAARRQGGTALDLAVGDLGALPLADERADLVLLADVLEHVAEPAAVVMAAARLLRRGGHLFVNTIARTRRSRLLAITLGEGLGYVPRGTHQWRMFVQPDELERMAVEAGLQRIARTGEAPRLWRTLRTGAIHLRASRSLAVGYAALYVRRAA